KPAVAAVSRAFGPPLSVHFQSLPPSTYSSVSVPGTHVACDGALLTGQPPGGGSSESSVFSPRITVRLTGDTSLRMGAYSPVDEKLANEVPMPHGLLSGRSATTASPAAV